MLLGYKTGFVRPGHICTILLVRFGINTPGKDDLMYVDGSNDNEAWLLIDNQNSTS